MKHQDIRVGMVLKLKPNRQEAYQHPTALVTVTELVPHVHYKRVWVKSGKDYYFPQDFARAAHLNELEEQRQ